MAKQRDESGRFARRTLDVEPGPRPQAEPQPSTPEDEARLAAQRAAVPPEPEPPAGAFPEWETAAVRALVVVPFLGLHWTVGRAGPPDIFIPDPTTRDELAATATAWLNQSIRLRPLARFGAAIAFGATAGGFLFTETVELRRYQLARLEGGRGAVDEGLPYAATVRAATEPWQPPPAVVDRAAADRAAAANGHGAADEVPAGVTVRAWRPPQITPDTDPNG